MHIKKALATIQQQLQDEPGNKSKYKRGRKRQQDGGFHAINHYTRSYIFPLDLDDRHRQEHNLRIYRSWTDQLMACTSQPTIAK